MGPDLAPLRHAQTLLRRGSRVDDAVEELCLLYTLDLVDAMAAIAACVMLDERGITVPDEQFARPYV